MVCMDYGSPRAMKLAYAVLVVWGSQLKLCLYIYLYLYLYMNCLLYLYMYLHLYLYMSMCLYLYLLVAVWSLQLRLRLFTTIHIYFHLSSLFLPSRLSLLPLCVHVSVWSENSSCCLYVYLQLHLNMLSYLYPLVAVTTIHILSCVDCLYCPSACMSLYGVKIPGQ